jgi:hypothetical protein
MKTRCFRLKALLLSLCMCFLLLLFSSAGSAAAHASTANDPAPTCSGAACNHTDPYKTHCDQGAILLQRADLLDTGGKKGGDLDLWWSPVCQTYWAYVSSTINPVAGPCLFPSLDAMTQAALFSADDTVVASFADPGGAGNYSGSTVAYTPQFSIASAVRVNGIIHTCNGVTYVGDTSGSANNS